MKDIEAQPIDSVPSDNKHTNQPENRVCQIGSLTVMLLILSVIIYSFRLGQILTFIPGNGNFFSFFLYPLFPFAVGTSGLLVNLVILFFFSTFFEKKFGSAGFFVKLEFFKLLFVLLSLAIHRFFNFVHVSSKYSHMLTLRDFGILFMILISQEAFERPNDSVILPLVNISLKNVSLFCFIDN